MLWEVRIPGSRQVRSIQQSLPFDPVRRLTPFTHAIAGAFSEHPGS
jgi:hypothetical protein